MAEVFKLPRRTTVLDFLPYQTKARVNLDYYEDEGTHSDTGVRIEEGKSSTLIVNQSLGFPARNFSIGSLGLTIGEVYSVRVRRKNQTGWGQWSHRLREILFSNDLLLPPNVTRGEPIDTIAQTIPTTPDFIGAASLQRDLIEHKMQTGHRWRRLKHTSSRYAARMKWTGLTLTERNTLVSFLEARMDAIEPFSTNDFVHGTRIWYTRRGQIHIEQLAPTIYGVQIEADQSKGIRNWTVELSTVGGPDTIL